MGWHAILDGAANGAAIAFALVAVIFSYRALSAKMDDSAFDPIFYRDICTYAVVAWVLSVAFSVTGLILI